MLPDVTRDVSTSESRETKSLADLNAIWNELLALRDLVESDHDRKLRRIESDLRWTMTLVGAQFITLIGSAIATLAGG
ncbi:MAG: hypothetical protein VW271_05190 [Chloroflexota bacterium]